MSDPWKRSAETLVALAGIAVLFALLWVKVISVVEPPRPAPPMDLGPVPVVLELLEPRDLVRHLDLQGTLTPQRRAALALESSGRVVEVLPGWRAGRAVEAGELLARVDPAPTSLARATAVAERDRVAATRDAAAVDLARAEAALPTQVELVDVRRRDRERLEALVPTGEASASLADQARGAELAARVALEAGEAAVARARAGLAAADAAVASAEAALAQATDATTRLELRAPFAGLLTAAGPEVGGVATAGAPLGELVDTTTLVLVAQVHESRLGGLVPGLDVAVTLPARPGELRSGRIARLAPAADPRTRNLAVEVVVDNRAEPLPAGLFAEGRCRVAELPGALWVRRGAFRWEAGAPLAFVAVPGPDGGLVAEPRPLTLGPPLGEGFLVEAGLAPGDRLVTSPLDRMDARPGADGPTPVRPRTATASAGTGAPADRDAGTVIGTDTDPGPRSPEAAE